MPEWSMKLLASQGVLWVRVVGKQTEGSIAEMIQAAVAVREEHGISKYLIDARDWAPSLSVAAIFNIPKLFRALGVALTARIAVLYPDDGPGANVMRFFETVSFNEGFSLRVFRSPEHAAQWLGIAPASLAEGERDGRPAGVGGARERP